jgi:Transposase zinc-binding domain/Putative transposase
LGFARLRCDSCRRERLLTFWCRTRQLCPSCGAKRGVIFGAFLREEVVEPVGHAQWVFTIPKILRSYFLRNRELLGDLSRAAWETVRALMAEAAGDPSVRPGMVVVPQTFGSSVNVHPHVHAIVSRGGWTKDGTWVPIPYVDSGAAARLFRHKVLGLLLAAGRIDAERVELILGWRHTSGF